MSIDLDQMRQALEAATPGHWEHDTHEQVVHAEDYRIVHDYSTVIWDAPEVVPQAKRDAHLIANAPTWISQLLEENARLTAQVAELKNEVHAAYHCHCGQVQLSEYGYANAAGHYPRSDGEACRNEKS